MPFRINIRNARPGMDVEKAYNEHDQVVLRDFEIENQEHVRMLQERGVQFLVPSSYSLQRRSPEKDEKGPNKATSQSILDENHSVLPDILRETRDHYENAIDRVTDAFYRIRQGEVARDTLRELRPSIAQFMEFLDQSPASVSILTQMNQHDENTYVHSFNVCLLSMMYAHQQNFSHSDLMNLAYGALLHDVGKTRVPRDILQKTGPLTEQERKRIESHCEEGRKILDRLGMSPVTRRIALQHHERPDGSGYPEGTTRIHPFSKIVSVIDVYDALTSPRPYHEKSPPPRAYLVMQNEFVEHPDTREIFSELIHSLGLFPIGCPVRLTNQAVGVVQKNHEEDLKHPTVQVFFNTLGTRLESPYRVDLRRTKKQTFSKQGDIYHRNVEVAEVLSNDAFPEPFELYTHLF